MGYVSNVMCGGRVNYDGEKRLCNLFIAVRSATTQLLCVCLCYAEANTVYDGYSCKLDCASGNLGQILFN